MIRADATVEHVFGRTWRVAVWEHKNPDNEKSYWIVAKTDTLAAQEGIRRFCAEGEGINDGAVSQH